MLLYLIKLEQHFMIIRFTKHIAELQGLRKHIARVANEKSIYFCFMFYHVSNGDLLCPLSECYCLYWRRSMDIVLILVYSLCLEFRVNR